MSIQIESSLNSGTQHALFEGIGANNTSSLDTQSIVRTNGHGVDDSIFQTGFNSGPEVLNNTDEVSDKLIYALQCSSARFEQNFHSHSEIKVLKN
jgi:hypothetical protein